MPDAITLTGNIATPPELRHGPDGLTITSFRLASTERRFDRATGSWVDGHTNWYAVSLFRGLADNAYRSLKKGDRVILSGRLRLRRWESGEKRGLAVEVDADAIGHDLRWGTTQYLPSKPPRDVDGVPLATDSGSGSGEDVWSAAGASSVTPDGEWAVPGGGVSTLPGDGAAGLDAQLVDADTPF